MLNTFRISAAITLVAALGASAQAADNFSVDPVHSSVSFMIGHGKELSYIHGRFNEFSGKWTIDKDDPKNTSFNFEIKVDSIDTNNVKRDEHLRAPDYFNTKQFPLITFKSTKVSPTSAGFEVTGDLTIHGVTKQVSLNLKGGHRIEDFKGVKRIGVVLGTSVKRSEYGITTALEAGLGDEVFIQMGIEAAKE